MIVRGAQTAPEVLVTGLEVAKRLKKQVVVTANAFGFIGNRTYSAYRRQCEFMIEEGAYPEDVDAAVISNTRLSHDYSVVALAALLYYAGTQAGRRATNRRARLQWGIAGTVLAVPALLFATYYFHWFHDAIWFYRFRSAPWTELTAAGAGLLAGLIYAWLGATGRAWRMTVPLLLLAGLSVPYLKALVAPLDTARLTDRCSDGVCLQSTPSTCGPASAASILRLYDIEESERTLAREAFTSSGGTENWYLARALRRRGFPVEYVILDRPVARLPYPSVAGVTLPGGAGHFIAILAETGDAYVIGEPMRGRMTKTLVGGRIVYDDAQLVASPGCAGRPAPAPVSGHHAGGIRVPSPPTSSRGGVVILDLCSLLAAG